MLAVKAHQKNVICVFQMFNDITKGMLRHYSHSVNHQNGRCESITAFHEFQNLSPLTILKIKATPAGFIVFVLQGFRRFFCRCDILSDIRTIAPLASSGEGLLAEKIVLSHFAEDIIHGAHGGNDVRQSPVAQIVANAAACEYSGKLALTDLFHLVLPSVGMRGKLTFFTLSFFRRIRLLLTMPFLENV